MPLAEPMDRMDTDRVWPLLLLADGHFSKAAGDHGMEPARALDAADGTLMEWLAR